MKPTNYVKLSIRGPRRYRDADAVPQAPSGEFYPLMPHDCPVNAAEEPRLYVTTWIFPFVEELEGDAHRALALAEAKCDAVAIEHELQVARFQVSTYLPSRLLLDAVFGDNESEAA